MYFSRNTLLLLTTWLSITTFYCYQYILRFIPNIIMPELMTQYNIGSSEFGSFAGIYYIGYVALPVPIGLALSKIGSKIILPLCMLLTAIGLIPLIYLNNWYLVLFGRFLVGIGSSAAIIGALQIFRIIFPHNFTRMLGLTVCLGLMTAVYINEPLIHIVQNIGLHSAIKTLIISGLILSIISFLIIPNNIQQNLEQDVWHNIKTIIGNRKLLFVSILAGLMVGPIEGFADAWGTVFLEHAYNIERARASTITTLIFTGMCIGCVILPFIADKTKAYYGITLIAAIVMTLAFIYLLFGSGTINHLKFTYLLIGIFCAYQVIIISKISTYVPIPLSGMAAALANMIVMSFGAIFHSVIGSTVNKLWNHQLINNVPIYSKETLTQSLLVIPIAMSISIIGFAIVLVYKKS